MAIHRVGQPTDRPTPSTDLGHILVTIDDLEALFTLLSDHTPTEVRARFNGGHFTDPHDLRSLSDGELSYLSVETPAAQVHLRSNRASVVSSDDEIRSKVEHWASTRQTKEFPRRHPGSEKEPRLIAVTFATILLVTALGCGVTGGSLRVISGASTVDTRMLETIGISAGAVSLFWLIAEAWRMLYTQSVTHAVIEPLTASEYRARTQAAKHPSRANLIAAVGALVAVVAIGVTLFLAYFPPK